MRERELEWLYAAPDVLGTFFCLAFSERIGGKGFALGRLYSYNDVKFGKLIHLQTSSPSVAGYGRMLAETVRHMNDCQADVVQCRASGTFLRRALRRKGFIWSGSHPVYCWVKNGNPPQGDCHLTFLRGDDAIRPYPE
jgi:hypothetical protein